MLRIGPEFASTQWVVVRDALPLARVRSWVASYVAPLSPLLTATSFDK
jgi:hypothetical protein